MTTYTFDMKSVWVIWNIMIGIRKICCGWGSVLGYFQIQVCSTIAHFWIMCSPLIHTQIDYSVTIRAIVMKPPNNKN